jgi:hypothetical protein
MTDELTPEEQAELNALMNSVPGNSDKKYSTHSFLYDVATTKDTTRLGFLKEEEIGQLTNPIRSFKHLELFANKIMNNPELAGFFGASSEIGTSTSLSREGFLTKLAVIQKKQIEDVTKQPRKNKGWFSKKEEAPEGPQM